MSRQKRHILPSRLARAQQRFARWRRKRERGTRIPSSLWSLATRLAKTYGISQTSHVLQLDYYALKKRAEQNTANSVDNSRDTFVELTSSTLAVPGQGLPSGEYTVEFEDAEGAKMRVHLKGGEALDLVALGRTFWNVER